MSADLKLILFDVDGTLVDSQHHILAAMAAACASVDVLPPPSEAILAIVGLSLPEAVLRLIPNAPRNQRDEMVEAYKAAFVSQREELGAGAASPYYPGALEALERLHSIDENILGVATGKSRRGLDSILDGHGLSKMFITQQVADDHPSKPHPSMIFQALREAGVEPQNAVMIGDTSFDMAMAQSAGISGVGVNWGYHSQSALERAGAHVILERFDELIPFLDGFWSEK